MFRLLTTFYESEKPNEKCTFPGESRKSPLSLRKTLPSLLVLSGLTLPMLLTESGRKLYVKTWLYGTLLGWLWVHIRSWDILPACISMTRPMLVFSASRAVTSWGCFFPIWVRVNRCLLEDDHVSLFIHGTFGPGVVSTSVHWLSYFFQAKKKKNLKWGGHA